MAKQYKTTLGELMPIDQASLEGLVSTKLRPSYDRQGLYLLRERAKNERNLRELYRGRAPYELLQNGDDAGCRHAAFVLLRDGLAFLHDGDWFSVRDFENLALGWSNKDPNVCIGNKGLGFRSVLDVSPSPNLFRVGGPGYFGARFSYALNRGHIDETLRRDRRLVEEAKSWGPGTCPIMSIPGFVRRQSLDPGLIALLDGAAAKRYGASFTTAIWLPAKDPDIALEVLRDLGPSPMTLGEGSDGLDGFIKDDVPDLILFLRNVVDVQLYAGDDLRGRVSISAESRQDQDFGAVTTTFGSGTSQRQYFQIRKAVPIPGEIRNQPDTSVTLRGLREARLALLVEISDERPIFDSGAKFHVYFPTDEPTGVGFVVHGDFHVKPDRTRLMSGSYNDWLFAEAAQLAAGPFLSALIQKFSHQHVFEALRPTKAQPRHSAGERFVPALRRALISRRDPYIPTVDGERLPSEVVLPRMVDRDGTWNRLLRGALLEGRPGLAFIRADADSVDSRAFLELAGVEELNAAAFVDLMEQVGPTLPPAEWWFSCYQVMAGHRELSRWTAQDLLERKIVPVIGGPIRPVPDEHARVVLVVPPRGKTDLPEPPPAFAPHIEFLDAGLADLLWSADEVLRSWVTSRLRAATFEVTDFLPRVIQAAAPQLFANETSQRAELVAVWDFVRASLLAAGRPVHDDRFWEAVGRLPVPVGSNELDIAPAFLAYFPDSMLSEGAAIAGLTDLRRLDLKFLESLATKAEGIDQMTWLQLLERAGVSGLPKILRYRRIVPGPLRLLDSALTERELDGRFEGHRQADENRAVMRVLSREGLWNTLRAEAPRCQVHPVQSGLTELTVIDGMAAITQVALAEHSRDDHAWDQRLRSLAAALGTRSVEASDLATVCQQCRAEVHKQWGVSTQMDQYRWVPTTFGPWTRSGAFLRLAGHRLIGLAPGGDPEKKELGDQLLPYTVARDLDEYKLLIDLGVMKLDNAGDASTEALVGFLSALGVALAAERSGPEVLEVRPRWRLVRGAIQEAYRSLNRRPDDLLDPEGLLLGTRRTTGPCFAEGPWHFAEPGSLIERAFRDDLRIVDADRNYASLFGRLGITHLIAGDTVDESLVLADGDEEAERLRTQIVESLSPHLLALIVARADDPQHSELVVRRLRERVSVRAARSLKVGLHLTGSGLKAELSVEPFYLQRTIVETQGNRREARYTLYVVAREGTDLWALDGDALGVAIAPIFLDGTADELAPQFPRVVTRFQRAHGDTAEMTAFLLETLGISSEAQELAKELLRGEPMTTADGRSAPPVVLGGAGSSQKAGDLGGARDAALSNLQRKLEENSRDVANRLGAGGGMGSTNERESRHAEVPAIRHEQEVRGRRGEDEMKRRLEDPEGWGGLRLVRDRRADGCGYDFLCTENGAEIELEVKTFALGGRVIVTLKELQEAYTSRGTYYLLGLLDDGRPASEWKGVIRKDPIELLLSVGAFELDAKLEAAADKLFTE